MNKTYVCGIAFLVVAGCFTMFHIACSDNQGGQGNSALNVIMNRKSVRHFVPNRPVTKEQLETILKAGMAAPTAVNKQPWTFVAIKDRDTLNKLAEALPYAKMLSDATAAIVVCGVPEWSLPGKNAEFWIQDCSAVSENILLAVESLGLGAVWTAVYPDESRLRSVRETLKIPENVVPLNVIPIGYPTGQDQKKDKYKADRIHWEKW